MAQNKWVTGVVDPISCMSLSVSQVLWGPKQPNTNPRNTFTQNWFVVWFLEGLKFLVGGFNPSEKYW